MSTTPRHPITVQDLWSVQRVGAPAPAPDGSFCVVPVATTDLEKNTSRTRLFRVPRAGRPAHPLTAPDTSSEQPAVSPDGRSVAFVRTPPGATVAQLHVMRLDGGEAQRLTDLPLGASDPRWFPDGRRIAVLTPVYTEEPTLEGTRRLKEARDKDPVKAHVTEARLFRFWDRWLTDGAAHHIVAVDADTGDVTDLTPGSRRWLDLMDPAGQYDIAPDGREIAFSATTTEFPHGPIVRWAIHVVPVDGGDVRCVTPDNPADDTHPRYSPDGRLLAYNTKRVAFHYGDRARVAVIDRPTGAHTLVTDGWDQDCGPVAFVDDGTVVLPATERGRTHLWRLRVDAGPATPTLLARGGTYASQQAARGPLVFALRHDLQHPPEVVCCDLAGDARPAPVTHFNDDLLATLDLAAAEEIEFPGAGGAPVHMFLLRPPGFDPSRRWPLLHVIHGGPYGCSGDSWHPRWNIQVMAAPGYLTALVNFHGSSSYGQVWADTILGEWGGAAADDIEAATSYLLAHEPVDPARMAITGGSFGGYMTAWLSTRTDRYRCAIAHAAVTDLSLLHAGDVTQDIELEFRALPWQGPDARARIDRFNPAVFCGNHRTPMLVIHGEQDYRVPVAHGLVLYGLLVARGVEARLVHYPDENHWILKPRNSVHWYGEFLGWLRRHLGAGPSPEASE